MDENIETIKLFDKEDKEFILSLLKLYAENNDNVCLCSNIDKIIGCYTNPFYQIIEDKQ